MVITVLFLKTPALLRRKQFLPQLFSVVISRALNEKTEKNVPGFMGDKIEKSLRYTLLFPYHLLYSEIFS